MKNFSLDKDMNIEVKASFFAKGKDAPLTGEAFRLRLYDKDIFGDDYLGESKLNDAGEGHISFGQKAFGDMLNVDTLPDFYFVLYNHNVPVFTSKVMEDVDFKSIDLFKSGSGEVVDLGTYLVEI